MGLTSLITKIFPISLALLGLFSSSCAVKKIRPLKEAIFKSSKKSEYNFAPEKPGTVFIDKAAEYGLENVEGVHLYAVDVNSDGHTDLVVLEDFVAHPKFYVFNPQIKKFELKENPFSEIIRASYLTFADFDKDGIYDVIVGHLNQKTEITQYPARIYKGSVTNNKLSYTLASTLPTGPTPSASIAVFDYNLDGRLDLYLGNWFNEKGKVPVPVADILLKGEGDGFKFTNVSDLLLGENEFNNEEDLYPNVTPTFGVSICDVDQNGFPDILTNNSNGYFNKLWINKEGKLFEDIGELTGYAADSEGRKSEKGGGNSFLSLCGDYNNDGITDIVVGNLSKETDTNTRDKSAILTGKTKSYPPQFYRSDFYLSEYRPNWTQGNRYGTWIDYNMDGLPDLIVGNMGFPPSSRLVFFHQELDHAYVDKALDLGVNLMNPSGMVTIDLNHDGVMDFISGQTKIRAGEIKTKIYLFINQNPRAENGALRFYLDGKNSNRGGIGAALNLTTNENKYRKEVSYSYGPYPSQNEEGVYFAFGKERPTKLSVTWPYGKNDKLGRISPVIKTYNLSAYNLKSQYTTFTLCEDGRMLAGKTKCY